MRRKLVVLYQKMYDLTNPKCGSCNLPNACCHKDYCEMTLAYAKEVWGTDLLRTEHPTLPLMGEKGCTAAPHLRPLCTAHVCEQHLMRVDDFTEQYFQIREEINEEEMQWMIEKENQGQ